MDEKNANYIHANHYPVAAAQNIPQHGSPLPTHTPSPAASTGGAAAARGVTPPPLHRAPSLDRSDLKAAETRGKGLRVEEPERTGGTKAVEGGSHRDRFGVFWRTHQLEVAVGRGDESAQGGGGRRGRGVGG